jgi:hypothetical protein
MEPFWHKIHTIAQHHTKWSNVRNKLW